MKPNEWRNNKKDFIKFIEFAEKLANKHNPDNWEKKLDTFDELFKALETVFDLIDRGVLVRDISKDSDFSYFTKQGIEISNAVVLINEAIKKATQ